MSGAARHRDGWLPVLVLAAFFVLALGSGAAWPAVVGGHAGGHVSGFAGGGQRGEGVPRGREFGGGRFGGGPVPHVHRGPRVFVFPYSTIPTTGTTPTIPATRTPRTATRIHPPTPLNTATGTTVRRIAAHKEAPWQ